MFYCIYAQKQDTTSTQRAQISHKVAHYPHIARIYDLESQQGDSDHPKNLIICSLLSLQLIPHSVVSQFCTLAHIFKTSLQSWNK